jgi:hypothetical protein
MFLIILGGILIGSAGILDFIFRLRMSRIGYKWVFLQGGAFNYREYHKMRVQHGWPGWPVSLMWTLYTLGVVFLIVGFFAHFGTHPTSLN